MKGANLGIDFRNAIRNGFCYKHAPTPEGYGVASEQEQEEEEE